MIGLDTNVLVRYITRDDEEQARRARELVDTLSATSPGFITTVVVAELWWVLGGFYRFSATQRCDVVEELLASAEVVVQDTALVSLAVGRARAGADLADALVHATAAAAGAVRTMTFDQNAAKRAGMTLV